jgi:molybdate/tungstate transport system substrate-binding protein
VDLAEELNFSDPANDDYYRHHAVVVLPGLGTPRSARTIAVPGARLMRGITMLNDAPHKQNAIKFLELLLSPAGTAALKEYGPDPISPAFVSPSDVAKLPESLRPMVKTTP